MRFGPSEAAEAAQVKDGVLAEVLVTLVGDDNGEDGRWNVAVDCLMGGTGLFVKSKGVSSDDWAEDGPNGGGELTAFDELTPPATGGSEGATETAVGIGPSEREASWGVGEDGPGLLLAVGEMAVVGWTRWGGGEEEPAIGGALVVVGSSQSMCVSLIGSSPISTVMSG